MKVCKCGMKPSRYLFVCPSCKGRMFGEKKKEWREVVLNQKFKTGQRVRFNSNNYQHEGEEAIIIGSFWQLHHFSSNIPEEYKVMFLDDDGEPISVGAWFHVEELDEC